MNSVLREFIENLVEVSLEEALRGFNFDHFKRLSANDIRPRNKQEEEDFAWAGKSHPEIAYAKSVLPELGEGSSRRVFALTSGKVLKIALNERGIAQNEAEVSIITHSQNNDLVTRIFDFDPKYKWLVAELVKPVSKEEFFQISGGIDSARLRQIMAFGSMEEFVQRTKSLVKDAAILGTDHWLKEKSVAFSNVVANPVQYKFVEKLYAMKGTHDLRSADIRYDHFGKTIDGNLRFFDYGYTDEVARKYYDGQ